MADANKLKSRKLISFISIKRQGRRKMSLSILAEGDAIPLKDELGLSRGGGEEGVL